MNTVYKDEWHCGDISCFKCFKSYCALLKKFMFQGQEPAVHHFGVLQPLQSQRTHNNTKLFRKIVPWKGGKGSILLVKTPPLMFIFLVFNLYLKTENWKTANSKNIRATNVLINGKLETFIGADLVKSNKSYCNPMFLQGVSSCIWRTKTTWR